MGLRARQNGGGKIRQSGGGGRGGGNGSPGGRGNNGNSPSLTTALLHFNGSDGGTTFTDEYNNVWAIPASGTAVTHTTSLTTPKFGTGSLRSNTNGAGNRGGIVMDNANICAFGNGDFSIDFWVYRTSTFGPDGSTNPWIFWGNNHATNFPAIGIALNNFTELLVYASSTGSSFIGGGPIISTGTLAVATSSWQHHALCRSGANLRLFVNGVQKGATYNLGTTSLFAATGCNVGGIYNGVVSPNFSMVGNIDEVYIRKGVAAFTADFTPPTSAYSPP